MGKNKYSSPYNEENKVISSMVDEDIMVYLQTPYMPNHSRIMRFAVTLSHDQYTVNEGTFYGNMLTATLTFGAFNITLRFSATAIEEYNMVRGDYYDLSKNILRARLSVTYLLKGWRFKFNYRTPYKAINIRGPYFVTNKPVYELQVGWPHKSWDIEALVRNPFSKYYKEHITMDYGCYNQDSWTFGEPNGCNIALKLTYSFSYGKKTKRGDITVDKSTKDAILKED